METLKLISLEDACSECIQTPVITAIVILIYVAMKKKEAPKEGSLGNVA